MRLLADENIHAIVVERLRAAGYPVEWIAQSAPGTSDAAILARVDIDEVILITNDRDFGELVFHRHLRTPLAILYTRLPHRLPQQTADRLLGLLEAGVATGQMITLTKDGDRFRAFPAGADNG